MESINIQRQFSNSEERSWKSQDPSQQEEETKSNTPTTPPALVRRRHRSPRGLKARERALLALLASCRYLTSAQVQQLLGRPRSAKTMDYWLRALAGDTGNVNLPSIGTVALKRLIFRAFDGSPLVLWTPTPTGYLVARRELGREVKVPRVDVGAAFAEHFVALTDLFVALAAPYVQGGVPVRDLPFAWDVAEDTLLPWREPGADGTGPRERAIRPDAVLEVPAAKRRLFVECETGSHTLVAVSRDKHQATVRKAERYETFLSGLADVPNRVTHYAQKYSDGWPAEVVFVVHSESRRTSTEAALAPFASAASPRVTFRVFTLEKALAYVQGLLPAPPKAADSAAPTAQAASLRFGTEEHRTVNAFVVESTTALAQANAALRRHGGPEVPDPPSTARMLGFLKKAQGALNGGPAPRAPRG